MGASPGVALFALVGPTAAGKTGLALDLCEDIGGEIISVDSVQVYRRLEIGSAKPTAEEQGRVPHHCLDLVEVQETIDAARWVEQAQGAIEDVRGRGLRPVLVGGTGMYLRSLIWGLAKVPPVPPEVRDRIRAEVLEHGPEASHGRLARIDPLAAARIAPRDGHRIGRALEVLEATGRTLAWWQEQGRAAGPLVPAVIVSLYWGREELDGRIDRRVRQMIAGGWREEVERLLDEGIAEDAPGFLTLGYRDVVNLCRGRAPESGLGATISRAHRRLSRRQMTWFRGMEKRGELQMIDGSAALTPSTLRTLASSCG